MEKGKIRIPYFSQLDKAIANGDKAFNMSEGEQVRDYLPVEKVAEVHCKNCIAGYDRWCDQLLQQRARFSKKFVRNYLQNIE